MRKVLAERANGAEKGHSDCLYGQSERLPGCDKQRNQQKLSCALGKPQYALQLSVGYPQGQLHRITDWFTNFLCQPSMGVTLGSKLA